jgi:phage tail-like protein
MKQAEIQQLLPEIFQRAVHPGNPLFAVLSVMELLQAPSETVLQNLETFFDPRRSPDGFVSYLASWVDLDQLLSSAPAPASAQAGARTSLVVAAGFPTGAGRLRELVAAAPYLSKWRGTARGLMTFLEIATGLHGFRVEEQPAGPDGLPRPFHLRIQAPDLDAAARTLVISIIELEKPAYVTYELVIAAEDEPTSPVIRASPLVSPTGQPGSTPPVTGPVTVSAGPAGPPPITGQPPVPPVGFTPPAFHPRLEVVSTGLVIPIPPGPVLVGRNDPVSGTRPQIDLNDIDTTRTVSRRHALITFDKGNFYLTEQINVANGTFLNGQRLTAQVPARLNEGDQVKFGRFEMVFHIT